jgi:hypothetical protein
LRLTTAALGADQTGDFRFHQRLGEHADAFSQDIAVLLLKQLANERRQIHSGLGHRVSTSVSSFSSQRELTERCAMADSAVYSEGFTEFPPRPGTLTAALLFGAGLLLRTLIAVGSYDRGYRAESVLSMMVDPLGSSYPTPEKLLQFYDQVETEVRGVPGVQDVAWSSALPLGGSLYGDFALIYEVVGDPPVPEAQRPSTSLQVVSPSYFSTLELPIVTAAPSIAATHAPVLPSASSTKRSPGVSADDRRSACGSRSRSRDRRRISRTKGKSSAWRSR